MSGMARWTRRLLAIAVMCALAGPGPAGAQDAPVAEQTQGTDRVDEMLGKYNLHPAFTKLGRGLSNGTMGWLEIPVNVRHRRSSSDSGGSFFTGLAYGAVKGLVRMGVGFYETITFFLPYPEHYAPILPTLEYFRREGREPLPLEY
jgi:putative exosortase-associated protein (TIGR04073 family)